MSIVAVNGDTEPEKASRSANLRTRLISAAILAPVVLGALIFGAPWFDGLVLFATIVMAFEWRRMVSGQFDVVCGISCAVVAAAVIAVSVGHTSFGILGLLAGAAFLFAILGFSSVVAAGWTALGTVAVGLTGVGLVWTRNVPDTGLFFMMWLLLTVWATDSAAYFTGRKFGGPKLAPTISPNKTWSGLIGGMVASAICGAGFALWSGSFDWLAGAAAGAVLAVVAQAGDLSVSFVKRRHDVKDTGRIIPGHGGMLDRVDGFIGTAPLLALLIAIATGERFLWI